MPLKESSKRTTECGVDGCFPKPAIAVLSAASEHHRKPKVGGPLLADHGNKERERLTHWEGEPVSAEDKHTKPNGPTQYLPIWPRA